MNTIRQAQKADLTHILKLQVEAFSQVAKLMGVSELPPLKQIIEELQKEHEQSIILKYLSADKKIIGSIRGRLDEENNCHVGKLIVSPDYQNQGIGKKLMYEIEKYFPSCKKFILFTSEDTKNTAHLYQKIGYKIAGKQQMEEISMYIMEKENVR